MFVGQGGDQRKPPQTYKRSKVQVGLKRKARPGALILRNFKLYYLVEPQKVFFIIWAPYRAITSSLFVLCYVCRTAGSAQKKRSLLVAQTLHKALNKAFRSIPGAALRVSLHLKTSATFLILFYFFR